jgi:hypothetical protein
MSAIAEATNEQVHRGLRLHWALGLAGTALLLGSLAARFLELDTLPGINGDEAWAGVQVDGFVSGEPYTFRTTNGLFLSPFFVGTEAILLAMGPPSFLLLRLPGAVWACVGLGLVFYLHGRVFRDWGEALLVVVLLAALPTHIAYSRVGAWEPSFLPLVSAPALYLALALAEGRSLIKGTAGLAIGVVLCVWVHLAAAVYVVLLLLALLWVVRNLLAAWLASRLGLANRRGVLTAGVAAAAAFVPVAFWVLCRVGGHSSQGILIKAVRDALLLLMHPIDAIWYLTTLGAIVWGTRAYEYFVGEPPAPWLGAVHAAVLLAMLIATIRLCRSTRAADRLLAALWFLTPIGLVAAIGLIAIHQVSNERYVLWVLPAASVLLVRSLRATDSGRMPVCYSGPIVVCVSAFFLFQFWGHYFAPLRKGTFAETLHPTFKTGTTEPKAEAARLISQSPASAPVEVVTQDWWVQHPVDYLLRGDYRVVPQKNSRDAAAPSDATRFVVGFTGSAFIRRVQAHLAAAGAEFRQFDMMGGDGRPVVTVLRLEPRTPAAATSDSTAELPARSTVRRRP